jgi:hypothetical protein
MLRKIISGGQSGAEKAALDTAKKFNLDHGGSLIFGKKSEHDSFSEVYQLNDIETENRSKKIEQNIIDSDATLIISHGLLTGLSLITQKIASRLNKSWCHIDLMEMDEFEGAVILHEFIDDNDIEVLNVAGPNASQDPFIYRSVKSIIETFIYMELMENSPEELRADDIILFQRKPEVFCATVDDAVKFLADSMHLRTKSVIANSLENQIGSLYFSLSDTIKVKLGLDSGNKELLESCRNELRKFIESETKHDDKLNIIKGCALGVDVMDIEDAAMVILKALRQFLKKDHVLRVIK